MGPHPEAGAVVDANGRVHGVDSLWVADASIMPDIPSANPHLATLMLAERIAGWLARTSADQEDSTELRGTQGRQGSLGGAAHQGAGPLPLTTERSSLRATG